jgi:hypothetical protein
LRRPGRSGSERYERTPELVEQYLVNHPPFATPGRYLVFKRWDRLEPGEEPLAVIFFAQGDVLGMFDVSARPHVAPNELTLAIPFERIKQFVGYMDESFLTTGS